MPRFIGPIVHARHSNFPKTKTQPTSLHLGTPVVRSATVMVTAHRFGSWSERAPSHHMIWGQLIKAQTRPSRPQTRASSILGPISALGRAKNRASSTPWEAFLAAGRPTRGLLSIVRLARHHVVLDPSPNPRGVTLSRPVYRKPMPRSLAPRPRRGDPGEQCRTLSTRLVGRYGDF
jgi:hypothetical protein